MSKSRIPRFVRAPGGNEWCGNGSTSQKNERGWMVEGGGIGNLEFGGGGKTMKAPEYENTETKVKHKNAVNGNQRWVGKATW